MITDDYRKIALAYNSIDPQGMIAFLAPTCTTVDEDGKAVTMGREEQLSAARYAVRTESGKKFVRREVFGLKEIVPAGDDATVTGTLIQELLSTDKAGTVVYVRFSWPFRDDWRDMSGEWRCVKSRQTGPITKSYSARPSPMIMGMIDNMRQQNDMLRNFNRGNNYSYCMNSDANQRYDYETRKSYCSN